MSAAGGSRGERLLEALRASGLVLPDEASTRYAVDFTLLLVPTALPTLELLEARHAPLLAALGRRTHLLPDAANRLLALAETPEFRGRLSEAELEAFRKDSAGGSEACKT